MNIESFLSGTNVSRNVRKWMAIYLDGIHAQEEGRFDKAREHFQRACARAKELKLRPELVISLLSLADVSYSFGDIDGAESSLHKAVKLSRSMKGAAKAFYCMSLFSLGTHICGEGRLVEGRKYLERADSIFRSGFAHFTSDSLVNSLVLTACCLGEKEWHRALKQVDYSMKLAEHFVKPNDIVYMMLFEQGYEAAKNLDLEEIGAGYKGQLDEIADLDMHDIGDALDFLNRHVIELCEYLREGGEENGDRYEGAIDCEPESETNLVGESSTLSVPTVKPVVESAERYNGSH